MKHKDLYSFPFKPVNDFLDQEIDKKLEEFYKSFENDFFGSRIISVNRERKEVRFSKDCFAPGEEEFVIHSFASDIKSIINKLIYNVLDVISEGVNICFISNQSIHSYLEKLERQYNRLKNHSKVKEFPFLQNYLQLISQELGRFKNLDGVEAENEIFKKSPFKPKDNIKLSFFHKLYDIAIGHELVSEDLPKEDFIDVFTCSKTKKTITFKCSNPFVVMLFETIKQAFVDLNASSIDKSKRFYTKQNKEFNASKYNSTLNRLKSNTKIDDLKEELKGLLSDYK